MRKAERKKFEQKLLELREGLTRNYKGTEQDSKTDLDDGTPDYIDFAMRSYTKEFLLSLSNMERNQLQQVEGALKRLNTEDYGFCASCDEEISKKRLAAAPWVDLCLSCQEEQERGMSTVGRRFSLLDDAPDTTVEDTDGKAGNEEE